MLLFKYYYKKRGGIFVNAKVIGEHIKEYRKNNNVSQRELAEMLFVSDKTISRWELGNGLPDIELLPKIAEILGISIDKLVGAEVDGENSDSDAIELYKQEIEKREAQLLEKERVAEIRQQKIKKIAIISSLVLLVILVVILVLALVFKPKYTLTLVGATTEDGYSTIEINVGASLPSIVCGDKTILGFIDEEYVFYTAESFSMPDHALTLRALIKEDMPLFAGSDSDVDGKRVAEHVMTDEDIPATKYTFAKGSKKGSAIQSRTVADSGEMENINVYAPSLGERFFLISVQNISDSDVTIRYRIENFGDHQGGLDYYTPSVTIESNSTTYIPVYFKNNGIYGIFESCDHFVILDEDIDTEVSLVVFGYIYTAEELGSISIVKAPDKFVYREGEPVDLSGMVVRADLVKGSTTGSIIIYNYTCDLAGKIWHEGMDTATVSFAGKTASVTINDPFQYKIAFAPAKNLESIGGTSGAEYISAEYVSVDDRISATKFNILAGAASGMEVEAWINKEIAFANDNGLNLRIPTFSNAERFLELAVTNNGGQEISFYYYAENYGDKGGVNITIAPGETKIFDFKVNPGLSVGCNYAFRLLSDVSVNTSITMHGYFYCKDEISGIEILNEAERKSFTVGDSFTSDGLVIKALGDNYDEVIISNFTTDLDGYTFTSNDVGTRAVTVYFNGFSLTYDIEINK